MAYIVMVSFQLGLCPSEDLRYRAEARAAELERALNEV